MVGWKYGTAREKTGLFYYNETIECQFKVGSDSYQRAIHHND